ncbi:hypothetical protein [Bradyrhizobium sp. 44]|jgi:hypothetical protein|uniref:hypothetical protein n=1 Tax=Bradyrhizobium sp. 44 TaxID=2782675 RepID=UPI001FF8101B|nr:hypothetical protein [Bradyrhizobium sp. 44]
MAKPAVSRDAFRGLLAFYAAKAHHDHKTKGEESLLRLFGLRNTFLTAFCRNGPKQLIYSVRKRLEV